LASPRRVAQAAATAAAEAAALADPSTSVWHLPYAAHVHPDTAYDADVPPADLDFPPLPELFRCVDVAAPSSLSSLSQAAATAAAASNVAQAPERIHFDVMAALDGDRMEEFKDTFLSTADALTPLQFVQVIRPFLPAQLPGITELQLIAKLCEFFSDVDVNGDGTMQWEEFTGAVIDAGMIEADVSRTDRILEYWNSPLVDHTRHAHWIDRLAYVDVLDQVISWEPSSDHNFRVYDAKTGCLRYTVTGHTGELLACEFVLGRLVITAGADRFIRFWDPLNDYAPVTAFMTMTPQTALRWHAPNQTLYTAGTDFRILSWGLDERVLEHRDPIAFRPPRYLTFIGHTDIITDLVVIPSINALASCSLDQSIIV